jgi:nitroreductase
MEALNDRKTTRNMSDEKLSPQMLSNLLWAAFGINRPSSRGRTAPSARNLQEVDIYVFLTEGVYLFDAVSHTLKPVLGGDYRAKTGQQAGVGKPPVSLVYVTDLDKVSSPSQPAWTHADCGFIGQNVYLFAASEGLASWFRALVDGAALAKLLSLRANQKVLYAQGIGYPAKA